MQPPAGSRPPAGSQAPTGSQARAGFDAPGGSPAPDGAGPGTASAVPAPCPACQVRSTLLGRLAGHLDRRSRDRQHVSDLLALSDDDLIGAVGAVGQEELWASNATPLVPMADARAGPQAAICRHDPRYPPVLRDLTSPPAVLHLGGDPKRVLALLDRPAVALVGARLPSDYGRAVARDLAAGLAATGVCVVSGMAMGVDSEAHIGALAAGGPTLAVLPGGVNVPYPATARGLHRRLLAEAGALSEMPAGLTPRRWCFVARNRIVAGLAGVTVVVEARERSGTLISAGFARDLGREVAAVPGPITSDRSAGTHALIRDGAHLVTGVSDVLDLLYGVGAAPGLPAPPALQPRLAGLLQRVRSGQDTPEALVAAGLALDDALAGLAELELLGCVRRSLSGRYLASVNQ